MINFFRAFLITGLMAALPVRAVYAPVPEQEQGKDFTFSVKAGLAYDSNIFGAATDEIDSAIFTFAPRAIYNTSLTSQTFFSASYGLTLDHFEDRPGEKLLDGHEANVRLAHAFSRATTIDVNNTFTIARNPESTISTGRVNANQSFTRNQLDGRFVTPVNGKVGLTLKARSIYYNYHDGELGRDLDRLENLFGVAGDYAMLPEVKLVGEYRHQDVYYRIAGERKNKTSEYLMGGFDYDVARKTTISGRLGAEWRRRRAERDLTSPYAELSAKYNYTERSFLSGGYAYTIEETSQPDRFTDAKVHRLFANVQHAVTALIVASGSLSYEPSTLQGRRGEADVSEKTVRAGAALSYLPTKNWRTSATYDFDHVRSDDPSRKLKRQRVALSATFTF